MSRSLMNRREGLRAAVALAVPGVATPPVMAAVPPPGRVLVVFMSRSGNTRVIAGQIKRAQSAMLFEIQSAQPYPDDYLQTVAQANRESDSDFRPPLKDRVDAETMTACRFLYLGFPIWGQTVPSVIRTFLSQHDLGGKTVLPFITHGGYGVGNSLEVLARLAPAARLLPPLIMKADQERETLEKVAQWLGNQPAPR